MRQTEREREMGGKWRQRETKKKRINVINN